MRAETGMNGSAKRSLQSGVDAGVQRILSEVGGDTQAAVNRLRQLFWTEEEARAEIARCLRTSARGASNGAKRLGAGGG